MGYRGPAPTGRALRSGKAHVIALVVEAGLRYVFEDPFTQRLLAGIGEVCDETAVGLAVVSVGTGRPQGWSIDTAIADGFILFCLEEGSRMIDMARRRCLLFVAVDSGDIKGLPSVNVDDRGGSAAAARHVAALGHRRIGILSLELAGDGRTGPVDAERERRMSYTVTRARLQGYLEGLAVAGIGREQIQIYETVNDQASAVAAVDAMLDGPQPPTAILAMSDTLALAAMARMRQRGLKLPQGMSVTGFDDVSEAQRAVPSLTTVRQPVEDKGRLAARMLLGLAERRTAVLPDELIVRDPTDLPVPLPAG